MIHYTTTNMSSLKMSYLLSDMGIDNCNFMLRLDNPELLRVDPFDENLTDLQRAMITHEIIHNPWYFFREIVRIPAGGALIRFEFHRGNIALIWAVLNDISCFVVWPRQTYKTTTMTCIYDYLYYWGSMHNKMVFIAHEDSIVKKNLQGVKDIRDNLPPWLNLYDKSDRDNEKEMYNSIANNRITCRAPARNEDGARKAGRGLTTPAQWFDEIAFVKYIAAMYDSISFAYAQASKSAKENGAPHHQIMTTTAGFLNTDEGQWSHNFMMSCADFTEQFYDMDISVVKTIIDNTSLSNFLNVSFMYYDLGKDEFYLEEQRRRLVNSPTPKDTLDREVLNKWKDISTEHPLGQERIERLNGLVKDPNDYAIINDTYSVRIYVDMNTFDISKPLIGGLDLGGNLRGDFSALTLVDPTDFKVVAVMRTNSQSTTLFAFAIITIMTDMFPNMILFPERNYNGAIIDMIVSYLPNSRKRVYFEGPDRPGLFNSKAVRPVLFNIILRTIVDEYGDRIFDKTIITEISGLIRTRAGRIDHKPGKHDDTLISLLLAFYFILYVDDNGLYFDKSIILSNFEKGNLIGDKTLKSKSKARKSKLEAMGSQYSALMDSASKVSSLDDIANIMFENHYSKRANVSSKVEVFEIGGDNFDNIEESDNISIIRNDLDKIRDETTVRSHHADNVRPSSSKEKDMLTAVFGW